MSSFNPLIGGRQSLAPDDIDQMRAVDLVRQGQIREGARALMRDPAATDLQNPCCLRWCKRRCFYDDYLSALKEENARV
jgi:hypothetical protein